MGNGKTKTKPLLSVIIITKNAAETLEDTLASVAFADEIIVVDSNSTDNTIDIALKYTDRIISSEGNDFAHKRELGLKTAAGKWVLYVDSDEIVTPALQREVTGQIRESHSGVFRLNRENYFLGRKMYPDSVERLFYRDDLRGWSGKVHESPITIGPTRTCHHPLLHYTHRTITSMLSKTNEWSELEADLRLAASHPPVAWWRLLRIAITEWWHQWGHLRVWQYGREGRFEGYFQILDKLIVYTKLWEKQQQRHD